MVAAENSAGAAWGQRAEAKALGTLVENVLGQELWGSQCKRLGNNLQTQVDRK